MWTACIVWAADVLNLFSPLFPLQGGCSWVPQEKERVRQMFGKPCGCVGKPKQDPDWRAESTEGHLLPQSWVVVAVCGLNREAVTNCYNKIKKRERLRNKNCFDRLCFSAHSGLVLRRIRSVPVNFEQLEFASFALVLVVFACEDSSVLHTLCLLLLLCTDKASQWEPAAEEEQEEEMQVLPENVPLKCRVHQKNNKKKKPRLLSQVSIPASFSEVRRGAHRATQVQQDLHQGNSTMFTWLSLLGHVSCGFRVVSCIPPCETQLRFFKHFVTEVISWIGLV